MIWWTWMSATRRRNQRLRSHSIPTLSRRKACLPLDPTIDVASLRRFVAWTINRERFENPTPTWCVAHTRSNLHSTAPASHSLRVAHRLIYAADPAQKDGKVQSSEAGQNERKAFGIPGPPPKRRWRRNGDAPVGEQRHRRSGAVYGSQGAEKSLVSQSVQRRLHRRPVQSVLDENLAETR